MTTRRRAVIIGIDDYEDKSISSLFGAVNDATEMHERLTKTGGFLVEDSHFLLNKDATSQHIRQAVSDLLWRADEAELLLLYFSGHGLTDGYGSGFIAPYDMKLEAPLVFGINMIELRDLLLATKNKDMVALIFDCCYSGIAANGEKALSDKSNAAIANCLEPLRKKAGSGRVILTSASSDEKSREVQTLRHRFGNAPSHPHGMFTFQLLEGLDGGAASRDGPVSLGSLIRFVESAFNSRDHALTPRSFYSEANALDEVMLCVPARHEEVTRRLREATSLLDADKDSDGLCPPAKLFRAIDFLKLIFEASPEHQEGFLLQSKVDQCLMMYRAPVLELLFEHYVQLSFNCEDTYHQLFLDVKKICYSVATARDQEFLKMIQISFKVATRDLDIGMLEYALTNYHSKRLPLQTPPDAAVSSETATWEVRS